MIFWENGDPISNVIDQGQLQETSGFMFKLLTSIGIVAMFLVGTVIGIQFMVASAEDKAKVKEALIPYVVGCAVIFGAFTIWSIAVNLGQDISGTSGSTGGGGSSPLNPGGGVDSQHEQVQMY